MEISLPRFHESLVFRFFADFDIQLDPEKTIGFTSQQKDMLQAIVASPSTLQLISRMALETDLADITGRQLSNLFEGPQNEEILDGILPCIPDTAKAYWEKLRNEPGDRLHDQLVPVFLAFDVKLRKAGIMELSDAPQPERRSVGPTLDAEPR